MRLYRDSKGRFRNADKITPENQERLYRGEPIQIDPVKIEIKVIRKQNKKTGKLEYSQKTIYRKLNGKIASKKDFDRFNYIRNLAKDSRQIFTTREVINFNVLPEINKALRAGNEVIYNGKKFKPEQAVKLIRDIRKKLEANSDELTLFFIEESENGNLRIISIKQDGDEFEF